MAYDLKVPGYGTLVKVDDDDSGSVFTTIGYLREVTPPPRETNTIDGTTLEDTIDIVDPGTFKAGEFTFTMIERINNTNSQIVHTLHTSKNKVQWQVVYPQDTPVTDQFEGWVKKIGNSVKGPNEYWMAEVTVQQTSVITRT
jgi:hypothetical protein